MDELRPTLWRTCRVLSNECRLRLLWRLFDNGSMNVGSLARAVGMTESGASAYLRALNARGLITAERKRLNVYYQPVSNQGVEHAAALLAALRHCHFLGESFSMVTKRTTAFTHPRRIDIARVLARGTTTWAELSITTQISQQSLFRHVRKLIDRGFVENKAGLLSLRKKDHPLDVALLSAILD